MSSTDFEFDYKEFKRIPIPEDRLEVFRMRLDILRAVSRSLDHNLNMLEHELFKPNALNELEGGEDEPRD